uniref:BPI2 domain-containing protein n=1 Tax=Macrostomum lignano TaxID=282301 RepID=A0A1I8HNS9_9PLAT
LISSQHGAVPWLNESAWSPDLLILRRQRFAIRLDKSSTRARAMFDTGIKKTPCYAVNIMLSGYVPITTPLLSLDTNVTVRILIGQVQFFRLALPEFAYSVELEIFDCTPKIHFAGLGLRNASESGCALFALVSAGSVADPRQLSARLTSTKRIFAGQLSPLSDANYLSLAANKVPVSVTVSVRLHRKCRPPSANLSLLATSASSNSETACELYSPSLQVKNSFFSFLS